MTVPHVSTALRPGDYLQIASERMAVDGVPDGEGFARIERVEIITDIGFLAPGSTHVRTRATRQIAVVLCHGMPGPVMLREGDQWTLGEIDSGRARWDSAYPWWPETPEPLFTGSRLAAGPHPFRSNLHCRCQQPWANRRKRRAENRGIRSHGETIPMDHHPPPPGIDMNKAQLVEVIADQLGGRQQAADAVDHVLDAIVRAVVAGERVSVTGFGTFERAERSARYARNPQTGERVRVRKTSVPRFRAGQGFKDLVSGSKKLPRGGEISVKKAPKGSISGGAPVAVKKAAAKKTTTKKAAAKKTTRAPARKTTKTAAKKAIVTTSAAKKATAKKAPAKKSTAKRAPAKTDIKKTAAKKTKGNGGDTGPLTSKKAKSGGS